MKFLFNVPSHALPALTSRETALLQRRGHVSRIVRSNVDVAAQRRPHEGNMTQQKARTDSKFLQAIKKGGASLKIRLGPNGASGEQKRVLISGRETVSSNFHEGAATLVERSPGVFGFDGRKHFEIVPRTLRFGDRLRRE